MKVFALTGKSGTGKSYRSMEIAHEYEIEAIIDDGLLISDNKILAGQSAKHEKTRMASVKCAIFVDNSRASQIKKAIDENNIQSILIVGTSEKMVNIIAERLQLLPIERYIHIEDVSCSEDIETAAYMRKRYGKHVIPAPTFEVKKQFSGYFMNPLTHVFGKRGESIEKTVMRPTYSYLGEYKISPNVICDICRFEALRLDGVVDILKLRSIPIANGYLDIFMEISLRYPCRITEITAEIKKTICKAVEDSTSIIVKNVNISVKTLVTD